MKNIKKDFDPKKIKALAIDLDGTTLLPDTTLGEKTEKVLKRLISSGMQIIIATGRAAESSERYVKQIGCEGPMVFFNGAEVLDVFKGKLIHLNYVDNNIIDYCIDVSRKMNIFFQIYLPAGISPVTGEDDPGQKKESLIMEKAGEDADLYIKHTGLTPITGDLKKIISVPGIRCIKGMFIADPSLHDELRGKLTERFGNKINIIRSFPTFLEILNTGVSKGEGLRISAEHRGLKMEDVMAFGDEENDLSMFETAGFCGAPESAREKIRERADFIYGHIKDEGLAVYLEENFLFGN